MKLPPKPKVVEAIADFLWRHDDCKLGSSDLVRDTDAWGRACAEAALEAAAKECEGIWAKRKGLESGTAYDAALAIRSIKVED